LAMDTFLFNFQPQRLSAESVMKEEVEKEWTETGTKVEAFYFWYYQTTVGQIDESRLLKAFKSYHHIMEPFAVWNK
jgi:type II restriction/modification system DNA methylase subunit YeeA